MTGKRSACPQTVRLEDTHPARPPARQNVVSGSEAVARQRIGSATASVATAMRASWSAEARAAQSGISESPGYPPQAGGQRSEARRAERVERARNEQLAYSALQHQLVSQQGASQ